METSRFERWGKYFADGASSLHPWKAASLGSPEGPTSELGSVPLVAVASSGEKRRGELWVLRASAPPACDPQFRGAFEREALEAWRTAADILPRSVPLLWRRLEKEDNNPLRPYWFGSWVSPGALRGPSEGLRGASFGLSFLIALAARTLDCHLKTDWIASVAITEKATLEPVSGIDLKVRTVALLAPQIRRFLVHPENAEDARREVALTDSNLAIIPVLSPMEALSQVFPRNLTELFIETGSSRENRQELVQSFFDLALGFDGHLEQWRPLSEAAELAAKEWVDLPAFDMTRLKLAAAITRRHTTNQGAIPLPGPDFWQALSPDIHLGVLAQFVQQSADTGVPTPDEVLPLVQATLGASERLFQPHFRLMGAMARLLGVTGQPQRALALSRDASHGQLEATPYSIGQLSRPLSFWFRLAGAMGNLQAFEAAEALHSLAQRRAALSLENRLFVNLARASAAIELGLSQELQIGDVLSNLSQHPRANEEIRFSARRRQIRAALQNQDLSSAEAISSDLEQSPGFLARVFHSLASIDIGMFLADNDRTEMGLKELKRLQPGLLNHLTGASGTDIPLRQAEYVARFFPY